MIRVKKMLKENARVKGHFAVEFFAPLKFSLIFARRISLSTHL